jgi:hypothetical protein
VGDTFEVAVDVEATFENGARLASAGIVWLTIEGIIDGTPTDDRDEGDRLLTRRRPQKPAASR